MSNDLPVLPVPSALMSAADPSGPSAAAAGEPPVEGAGRRFTGHRKVRLGDVTVGGRLRLDALTRYTQDVSDDDTTDAGLSTEVGWVVRRTVVRVERAAVLGEELRFTTWCSGLGRRWAERSLEIRGEGCDGARYRVATLWIAMDPAAGRPTALTEQFLALYGEAAAGRTVQARLTNPKPRLDGPGWPWPLRVADLDTLGHVNNAAYWAVVEECLHREAPVTPGAADGRPSEVPVGDLGRGPLEVTIEYSAGLGPGAEVRVHEGPAAEPPAQGSGRVLWLTTPGPTLAASALIIAASFG